jgi:hypothetical protein
MPKIKLPKNSVIDYRKLRDYLLVFQDTDDKSKFLESGGYFRENWESLQKDIIDFILPLDAMFKRSTKYGDEYEIIGSLPGKKKNLKVRTFWYLNQQGKCWFVTLFPYKGGLK